MRHLLERRRRSRSAAAWAGPTPWHRRRRTVTRTLGFLHVSEHVARNPIARAVAASRLHAAVRDSLLQIYLHADGDDVSAEGPSWARVLYVAWLVLHARGASASPDARVMRGAMSSVEQLARRGWRWSTEDAAAIDAGLTRAQQTVQGAPPSEVRTAWEELDALERGVRRSAALACTVGIAEAAHADT